MTSEAEIDALADEVIDALADEVIEALTDNAEVFQPPVTLTLAESGALLLAATHCETEGWHPALTAALESAVTKIRDSRS